VVWTAGIVSSSPVLSSIEGLFEVSGPETFHAADPVFSFARHQPVQRPVQDHGVQQVTVQLRDVRMLLHLDRSTDSTFQGETFCTCERTECKQRW
jgi:hypothetical protein